MQDNNSNESDDKKEDKDPEKKEKEHALQKIIIEFGENNKNLANNSIFPNNSISTTKYNLFTFVPKSLIFQFARIANVYFLIICLFSFFPFSPIEPVSMVGTFGLVLVFTMIKEGVEDYNRYVQDRKSNMRLVNKLESSGWSEIECYKLRPGDIIKVNRDEEFSADTIIIKSGLETGNCYIATSNLDGETNLKEKASIEHFKNTDEKSLNSLSGSISCEGPNANLSSWEGIIDGTIFINLKNIILKGCSLKNTPFAWGIVVYSGSNTKIMKNSKSARQKVSNILRTMNKLLYSLFLFQVIICVVFAIFNIKWNKENKQVSYIFSNAGEVQYTIIDELITFFLKFMTFFVGYNNIIPISLYFALDILKLFQKYFVQYDNEIFDYALNSPGECRSTDLIEELGQVEFIFSDKTGTLTQNCMVLKKCYINSKIYGSVCDESEKSRFTINGDVTAAKKMRLKEGEEEEMQDKEYLEHFFTILAVCHEVFPEETEEKGLIYQGASPDDIALTAGAQQLGIEFKEKSYSKMKIINHLCSQTNYYENITIMPFDSDRKRMSTLVKDLQNNKYYLFSKGADTMMIPRLVVDDHEKEEIEKAIKIFSKEGLRVLCLARREVSKSDYEEFVTKLNQARENGEDLNKIYETLECGLSFIGCTAVEDKLQEGVSDAIYSLLTCNIRVWVLTGDKQDIAEEIAKSCKLINENMFTFYFYKEEGITSEEKLNNKILEYEIDVENEELNIDDIAKKIRQKNKNKDMSIIIDGMSLADILSSKPLKKKFFFMAQAAKSVVCCRVSPKQKAKVVQLAKSFGEWITLSIGDGANDVPMILEAHIGVGIQGKEGTQAVRSSDFAIGQFRFLERLLLVYGRTGYIRIGKFICYYFYKNVMLVITDCFFAFSNGLSGQIYFADWLITSYNVLFTSWPCIITFALEKDVEINVVKKFPMLYMAGQEKFYFNLKMFWSYLTYSVVHAALSYYISQMGMEFINSSTGFTLDHWAKSSISFSIIVSVVNYKLLVISQFWNALNVFATCFAIFFYYLALLVLCSEPVSKMFNDQLGGRFFILLSIPKFLLVMSIAPFVVLLPDIIFRILFYLGNPNPSEYIISHLKTDEIRKILDVKGLNNDKFNSKEFKECDKLIQIILQKARKAKLVTVRLNADNDLTRNLMELQLDHATSKKTTKKTTSKIKEKSEFKSQVENFEDVQAPNVIT